MDADIPYMTSAKNLGPILEKLRGAGSPPRFSHEFLRTSLGFTSSADRSVVKVLKRLGFLTADSTPTERYNLYRSESGLSRALATGLKEGWSEVFLADQQAPTKSVGELTGTFKSVSGKSDSVAEKMAATFKRLSELADWSATAMLSEPKDQPTESTAGELGITLSHDIHIHLPPTSDTAVYTAIFRALREELLD